MLEIDQLDIEKLKIVFFKIEVNQNLTIWNLYLSDWIISLILYGSIFGTNF